MKAVVVTGKTWRCKLSVFDYTEGPVKKWANDEIKYCVEALPAGAHKSTAFARGTTLYYGNSLVHCFIVIWFRTRKLPKLPKTWTKYKALEAFKEATSFESAVKRGIELS